MSSIRSSRESPSPSPSPSPPRRMCCFGGTSKKAVKKKLKGDELMGLEREDKEWGKNDEILTDFKTFSVKEQERKLKKALKDEEKASREAAKVVKWVKQASARMDVSAID